MLNFLINALLLFFVKVKVEQIALVHYYIQA